VLICASDDRTCSQLQQYIRHGSDALLQRLYTRTLGKKDPAAAATLHLESHREGRGWAKKRPRDAGTSEAKEPPEAAKQAFKSKSGPSRTLTQMVGNGGGGGGQRMGSSGDEGLWEEEEERMELDLSSDCYYGVVREPLTVIHPLRGCTDPYSLTRVLHEVEPSFVVLYDAELSFVRQLEVYKANRAGKPLR